MESNRTPVVEFCDFTFQYFSQAEPTLHDINLTIYEGEKVLIVGGGPAGLECALTAARQGHEVTIADRKATWGGRLK